MYTHSPASWMQLHLFNLGPLNSNQSRATEASLPRKRLNPELVTSLLVPWATIPFENYQILVLLISVEAELS